MSKKTWIESLLDFNEENNRKCLEREVKAGTRTQAELDEYNRWTAENRRNMEAAKRRKK